MGEIDGCLSCLILFQPKGVGGDWGKIYILTPNGAIWEEKTFGSKFGEFGAKFMEFGMFGVDLWAVGAKIIPKTFPWDEKRHFGVIKGVLG